MQPPDHIEIIPNRCRLFFKSPSGSWRLVLWWRRNHLWRSVVLWSGA